MSFLWWIFNLPGSSSSTAFGLNNERKCCLQYKIPVWLSYVSTLSKKRNIEENQVIECSKYAWLNLNILQRLAAFAASKTIFVPNRLLSFHLFHFIDDFIAGTASFLPFRSLQIDMNVEIHSVYSMIPSKEVEHKTYLRIPSYPFQFRLISTITQWLCYIFTQRRDYITFIDGFTLQ